jgi:hypothetical protein
MRTFQVAAAIAVSLVCAAIPVHAQAPASGSPRFQCNNWRYANPALARGWCW